MERFPGMLILDEAKKYDEFISIFICLVLLRAYSSNRIVTEIGVLLFGGVLRSHAVFGCRRSIFQSLVAPMVKGIRRFGIAGVFAGAKLGAESFQTVRGDAHLNNEGDQSHAS